MVIYDLHHHSSLWPKVITYETSQRAYSQLVATKVHCRLAAAAAAAATIYGRSQWPEYLITRPREQLDIQSTWLSCIINGSRISNTPIFNNNQSLIYRYHDMIIIGAGTGKGFGLGSTLVRPCLYTRKP